MLKEKDIVRTTIEQEYITKNAGYRIIKRCADIICSVLVLLVLFVPMFIVSAIILIDSPGASPIYVQTRVGKNGKLFKFYKFRSMVPNAEKMLVKLLDKNEMEGAAFKMKNDPRITRVGRFIRRSGIDELPQFWNVLKGDMSLVGPRPPLPREVEEYDEWEKQRLAITPGITCYWQIVPKRNSLTFEQWVELDIKYIRERSLLVDIGILFKTFAAICRMDGI